jgi:anti-sigma regulatory factor (Ser/Thr protein kinase)
MPPTGRDRREYVHLTVPAAPAHLQTVRHEVMRCLASLPMSQDRREEVVLAVGEAAANCVEHAYRPDESGVVELTYWTESDALCVEVCDRGRWREPPPSPRPPGQGGLGLVLMRQLIDCVLIHHDAHGTKVLLRHPMTEPAPDRSPAAGGYRWYRAAAHSHALGGGDLRLTAGAAGSTD